MFIRDERLTLMPAINQIQVFNQKESGGVLGCDGCGVNSFKNSLLALLLAKDHISFKVFDTLSKSKKFVDTIYDAVKQTIVQEVDERGEPRQIDVTPPRLFDMLNLARNGKIDLSMHGITQDMIDDLNLSIEGDPDISVALVGNCYEYGLTGADYDLDSAATLVKLARNKGEYTHAFSMSFMGGMTNGHWMSVVLHQDVQGKKTWDFMDSYKNQTFYKKKMVNKIDAVLKKSEPELRSYLLNAYDNSSSTDKMKRQFGYYFDSATFVPKDLDLEIELTPSSKNEVGTSTLRTVTGHFVDDKLNREVYISLIEQRFRFMENVGWLAEGIGKEELNRIQIIHGIAKFMVDKGANTHPVIRDTLPFIVNRLDAVIRLNTPKIEPKNRESAVDHLGEQSGVEPSKVTTSSIGKESTTKDEVLLQTVTAVNAMENGQPEVTPAFSTRLVNSISNFLKGITQAVTDLFNNIVTAIKG